MFSEPPQETGSLLSDAKMSSTTESTGAPATPNLQELVDLAALQESGVMLDEIFENQRFSPVLKKDWWGSTYPGHLQPADPWPWSNRLHQKASGRRTLEEVTPPDGWEYLDEWQLDTTHTECDAAEGWSYGHDFPQLQLLLLELRLGPTAGQSRAKTGRARTEPVAVHVRWRRWVRRRRLIPGVIPPERLFQSARGLLGGGTVCGYDGGLVPEAAVLCEGWLARMKQGRWVQHWVVLIRAKDGRSLGLLYCDSREAQRVLEVRMSPPASLRTNVAPHLNEVLRKVINADSSRRCFGLGHEGSGGTLHRAISPSDMRRWCGCIEAALIAPRRHAATLVKTPLGIGVRLDDDNVVTEVREDSQAARAGNIQVGDQIVAVNGVAPSATNPLAAILQGIVAGTELQLLFVSAAVRRQPASTPFSAIPARLDDTEDTRRAGKGGPKAGSLTIELVGASGLAVADGNCTSDPYAQLTVKADTQTHSEKTNVVENSLNPTWGERWTFEDVWSGQTEVVVLVKDDDFFSLQDEPIGQVNIELAQLNLSPDGTLFGLTMPLATVTEGGRKSKYKVTGDISMKIGWCQGSKEEQAAAVAARVPVSKELKDYEEKKEEELKGGEASEVDASDAAALEEERRKEAIMRRVPRGDYQLQVHVIEARDLVGRDYSGISDPAVFVRCFGQSARTQGKDGQTSPVWDETLFISAKDLDEDKLNASQIEVAVYDLDTFSRSDLVGQYTFDVLHVYYGKDHQIWRQWVALSAPHAARDKFLGEDAHGGIQGYLKLSVTLLGPGDKPVIRPDDDDDEEGQEGGVILMPPTLKREVVFLRVGVHKAWQLPKMDKNLLGQKTGIDAYVTLRFAGYEARTAVVTSENPAWFSEFWVPVLVPSVGQKIRISVCDRDPHQLFDKYEEVDVLLLSFDDVLKGQAPKLGWYHLYGMSDLAQEQAEKGTFSKVLSLDAGEPGRQVRANLRSFSSEWRGKLLLGLEIARPDPPLREKLLTRPLVPLQPAAEHRLIPEALYELRVAVLAGSDLGGLLKDDDIAGCYVEAVVQEHRYRTGPDPQHPSPPTGDIGYASWLLGPDAAEGAVAPGVLQTISQERQLHLPKDPKQLPAVLVYLCSFSSDHQRVGFLRFEPAALLAKGFAFAPAWHVLAPTSAADDGKPMPALLLSVSFGLASGAAAAPPWPPPRSKMPLRAPLCGYELRLHLFQGRGLPAKDSSGVLDAFVTAQLNGGLVELRRGKDKFSRGSAVSPPTANPVWYETLLGQAWLPPLELAPEVVVTCWDYDDGPANNISKKDFVGVTRLSLRNALHAPGDGGSQPLPPPQWVQLQARGAHKGSGELLLKLELLPLDGGLLLTYADAWRHPLPPSPEPLPNLQPSTRPMLLELAVVGLRGVRTSENLDITTLVMGPRRPFVEVDAGSRPAKRSGAGHSRRTSASNTPSAQNPTYLEVLALPLDLPTNRLFLPALNVRVRDSLFGGLRTPLLGVSAVSLTERLPNDWKDHEERPWQSPNEVTVETWENQRWVPVVDWSKPLLPLDPPPFSTWHGPPFFALPFSAFELPTQEWEWQTEWAIDFTTNPDDAEGFGYAFDFTDVNSRPNALGTKSGHDFVRRRRWFRTYVRTAAPVLAALEVQPSATQSGLSEDADSERAAKKQRAAEGGEAEEAGQKRLRGISTRGGVTRGVLQLANGATPMLSTRSGNNGRGEDGSKEVGEKECDESEGEWLEEKLLHELEKLETEVRSLRQQLAKIKAEEVGATLSERASLQRQKAKVEKALTKAQAELREREKEFDAAVELPRYMRADEDGGEPERQTKMQELEGLLGDVPFEHFAIESGQGESRVEVAKLKAVVQLKSMGANGALNPHDNEAAADEAAAAPAAEQYPTDPIAALREPREYVVRLYVLRGWNLVPMDVFSTSDPYLRVSLAGTTLDRRKQYLKNVTTAHFYQTFELRTRLPGDALLRIECLDRDSFGQLSDDLIGTTEIDLEDRVFSPRWRNMFAAKPPVEWRSLYSKMSKNPQGVLELWVDILTPEQAEAKLPWDIAPPPPQSWELRVVCWKVKDLPRQGRDYSGLADLYVRAVLTDQKEKRTDTHFRAPKGRACWNWRFKWAVELDSFLKYQRLEVQLWDKDIGFNDHIGVATIPLDTWFTRVYRRKHMRPIYLTVEPPCQPAKGGFDFESMAEAAELVLSDRQALLDEADEELEAAKFWLPLSNQKREEMGWLMLSVELVPAAEIEGRPAGHGRSEPNSNPFLPKPTGRLRFTFNPFVMLYRLLGPKICRQLSGCICLILYLAILFYMIPTLMGHLVWAPVEAAFG